MRVGIVVHGPKIVDSGYAKKIINLVGNKYSFKAKLGGTIGRVAVIDNNLTDIIDISEKLLPSEALKRLEKECDILLLLNYGKSKITGHTFGKIVVEKSKVKKPIIQIERPGEKDGSIIIWNYNKKADELIDYLKKHLNLNIEKCISDGLSLWEKNGKVYRKIHGVEKGEPIIVNGVVIGRALDNEVILIEDKGKLKIIGGELKEEGLNRLGKIDLKTAVIKTGKLRRDAFIVENFAKEEYGKVKIINHAGEDALKYKDCMAVITIGDDTTEIVGDILSRFGVRIVGIVDGDKDGLLEYSNITRGSVVYKILNIRDDDAGKLINLDKEKYYFNELLKKIENILKNKNVKFKKIVL